MCDECDPFWERYKEAERKHNELKQAYLIQCQMNCKERKADNQEATNEKLPESHKILYDAGFLESQSKAGLWFKNPEGTKDITIFIDFRKGPVQAYGFKDGEPLTHEFVKQFTKDALTKIRMNVAKASGQTELFFEKPEE